MEAMVDMENSGSGMSTQDLPRFGPSLLEVKTYSCSIILISQGVTSVLVESSGDLLLARLPVTRVVFVAWLGSKLLPLLVSSSVASPIGIPAWPYKHGQTRVYNSNPMLLRQVNRSRY